MKIMSPTISAFTFATDNTIDEGGGIKRSHKHGLIVHVRCGRQWYIFYDEVTDAAAACANEP